MRIAVTGASGFVGRHVCVALAGKDVELVLTHHATMPEPVPGADLVRLDLAKPVSNPLRALGYPDVLVHLAWSGLPNYDAGFHLTHELDVQTRFLSGCVADGLPHLVVSGTCLEYGLLEGLQSERHECKPTTAYGQAKDKLRMRLEELKARFGFGFAWARLFYLFGSGQAPTSLYSQLKRAASSGIGSLPMSPGDQRRDFLPVELAAEAIARLAVEKVDAGVVNVCSGEGIEVRTMAKSWLDRWGSSTELDLGRLPYPAYEPFAAWGDRRKLELALGMK